jgi:phosphoglycerol geranylgeranyltransferase
VTEQLNNIEQLLNRNRKQLAVLIDPDKWSNSESKQKLRLFEAAGVDYLFIGGSLNGATDFSNRVKEIKANTKIPLVLFPGHPLQLTEHVDATLFISLISGRNAEYLIGHHVVSAPYLKSWNQEVIPTGYLLVESSQTTTAVYVSQTTPLPANKPEVAAATALAGKYLGMRCMYLDTGSGAKEMVSTAIIESVKQASKLPLIVGGGIRNQSDINSIWRAGADIVVIGTAIEENPTLLFDIQKPNYHDTQTL